MKDEAGMTDSDSTSGGAKEIASTQGAADQADYERIQYDAQSAHLAFQQQLLAQADITEEERQQFLIAASCPCCGAGGLSISLKLKSGSTPTF
jgi:hypothetical protein